MGKYKLIVLSDAVAGREDEYNEWYSKQHLSDVIAVPGFVSAQRFKMQALVMGEFKNKYLAIYDIDTDEPQSTIDDLMLRWGTDAMIMSDTIDLDTTNVALFEECSQKIVAGDR
jgi:hypothetical protein